MLSEHDRELIAAAVDGDLPADREAAFRRLIAESAAAHALYLQLVRDRGRLRDLPREPAPPGLYEAVMGRVREAARPAVPARPPAPARRGAWLPAGLAASVLLCVGGASFLFFQSRSAADRIAAENRALPKDPADTLAAPKAVAVVPPPRAAREVPPAPRASGPELVARSTPDAPRPAEVAPSPRDPADDRRVFSPPGPEAAPFESVQVRLPVLLPVAELAADDGKRRVAAELDREPAAYRLDLFVNDPHKAAEALVVAGRGVQLAVSIDAAAHDRLRKRLPFGWAVFAESLTPAEAADWLAAAVRAVPEGGLTGAAHLVAAGKVEQKEWKELLGIDPAAGKRSPAEAPPKSISAGTADQVASALQRSGSAALPERPAVLVTYLPREGRVSPALSKEVRQFAERRGERRANAVPLMVVIRPTSP